MYVYLHFYLPLCLSHSLSPPSIYLYNTIFFIVLYSVVFTCIRGNYIKIQTIVDVFFCFVFFKATMSLKLLQRA